MGTIVFGGLKVHLAYEKYDGFTPEFWNWAGGQVLGLAIGLPIAAGAVALLGTTPAGVAVLIGAGAVLGYLELKEVLQDVASVYDDTVIGGCAETILDLMESFESKLGSYAKLAEDAIESALKSIPTIHFASGDTAILKTEANQWLVGNEQATLVGSDQDDFIVHFGSGEVFGRAGDDTLIAIMPDVLGPDDVLEMRGGAGDDWVMAFGGDGAKLYGGAGSDWVVGWSGQDRLWGGDGTLRRQWQICR